MFTIRKRAARAALCVILCVTTALASAGCGGALGGDAGVTEGAADTAGANAQGGATQSRPQESATSQGGSVTDEISALFDEDAITGPLAISAYETMTYRNALETAAQAFNEKYPGVEISVDTFSVMPEIRRQESADGAMVTAAYMMEDDPQARADYANKVNTELMSGAGADILAVDVIPVAKYVESGLLENLAPYMERDGAFDRSEYRANILDAVTWKDGTWFLPMDYSFNYYTYDTTLIDDASAAFGPRSAYTSEQLMDMAIPLFDGETMLFNMPVYSGGRGDSAWRRMLRENWQDFVDIANKKVNFTDGRFVDLLNKIISYGENGYVPANLFDRMDREEAMARIMQAPTDRYYFKPKGNMALLSYALRDMNARVGFNFMGGVGAIEDDDEIAGIAANADGTIPFTYTQAYAINSNSKNKRAAWEFIKFMLSGEIQASGAGGALRGLPVHNQTRADQMSIMLASMSTGMRGGGAMSSGAIGYGRIPVGPGGAPGGQGNAGFSPGGGLPAPQEGQGVFQRSDTPQNRPAGEAATAAADGKAGDAAAADGDAVITGDDSSTGDAGEPGGAMFINEPIEIDPEVLRIYNETIELFSDQINTFEIKDTIIDDLILAEADYFFEGVKTAEEVAAALQSRVGLYLSE